MMSHCECIEELVHCTLSGNCQYIAKYVRNVEKQLKNREDLRMKWKWHWLFRVTKRK